MVRWQLNIHYIFLKQFSNVKANARTSIEIFKSIEHPKIPQKKPMKNVTNVTSKKIDPTITEAMQKFHGKYCYFKTMKTFNK